MRKDITRINQKVQESYEAVSKLSKTSFNDLAKEDCVTDIINSIISVQNTLLEVVYYLNDK